MDRLPGFIINRLGDWAWVKDGYWDLKDGITWSSSSEYPGGDEVSLTNVMDWGAETKSYDGDLFDNLPRCPLTVEVRFGDCDWNKWKVFEEEE